MTVGAAVALVALVGLVFLALPLINALACFTVLAALPRLVEQGARSVGAGATAGGGGRRTLAVGSS